MSFESPVIMVVDDEPENLHVLEHMLLQDACRVVAFRRGELALNAAHSVEPDLILLDVRMPQMDGYAVCRALKQDDLLKDIPVIFLSGLSTLEDKIQAFEAGGVDYVTKPLFEREVMERVHTHLAIRWQTANLEALVAKRSEELIEAHRRLQVLDMAKTHWISMLAHEMRTPLTSVVCTAEMLFSQVLQDSKTDRLRRDFNWSCDRIRKLIDDAIMLATIGIAGDGLDLQEMDLYSAVLKAQADASNGLDGVSFNPPSCPRGERFRTWAAPSLLSRALADLFLTAGCCIHHTGSVDAVLRREGDRTLVEIVVKGEPLSPEALATFFDVCEQRVLVHGGYDYGLAPALALRSLKLFGGDVRVRNTGSEGFVITATLPEKLSAVGRK